MRILRKFGLKTVFCLRVPEVSNFLTHDIIIIMRISLITKIDKFVYMELFNAVKNTRNLL